MLQMNFILIPYFDWLLGALKGQIFEKKSLKIFSSETVCYMKLILCIHVPGISLYKEIVFCFFCMLQSDKKSGCYGNIQFADTYNWKSRNWLFLQSHFGYLNFVFA